MASFVLRNENNYGRSKVGTTDIAVLFDHEVPSICSIDNVFDRERLVHLSANS
jgi:hypothetical protein